MIDFNSAAMRRSAAVQGVHDAVDEALIRNARSEKRRTYLGASSIGGGCERRIQYEYLGTDTDPDYVPEARTQRIFARGHIAETMAIKWLRDAGYDLRTEKADGGQFGFKTANGKFAGHCDGIIMSGPGIDAPCIWEHKALGSKSWKAIEKGGLAKAKPEYCDQISLYQAYLDLTAPALFMATCMDDMAIYLEFVDFDQKRAQAASDRAVAIILDSEAKALRPKVSDEADFWLCRGCPFRRRCHG
jgi:hypothetical protein